MKKVILPIAVVVLLALGLAAGQEESEEVEQHGGHGIEVLNRNIRLTFEITSEDGEGNKAVSIVTAVPKYKLVARFEGEDGLAFLSIVGAVGPRNDGRILALLEVETIFNADESETELAAECGVLLEPGAAQEVARWGGRALVVHTEYTD